MLILSRSFEPSPKLSLTPASLESAFEIIVSITTSEIFSFSFSSSFEKFVENFVRRYAEGAQLSQNYKIEIFDVNETPPKVTIRVSSNLASNVTNEIIEFDISNRLSAILETEY